MKVMKIKWFQILKLSTVLASIIIFHSYYSYYSINSFDNDLKDTINRNEITKSSLRFVHPFKLTIKDLIIEKNELFAKRMKTKPLNLNSSNNNDKLKLFDLKKPLEPSYLYQKIACRDSIELDPKIQTVLCIHDVKKDAHVSLAILSEGVWEEHILSNY
jgi:hypothetical protein